jgi:hypothetical protein
MTAKPALAVPFEPGGTQPVPPAFEKSNAMYQRGRAAYQAGEYEQAASDFVNAATALRVKRGSPYADTAASNRVVLYQDAAYAWSMAGKAELGRSTFEQLRKDGAASDDDLAKALAILHEDR